MMEGWKRVKIGDLGEVITGNTPPKKDPTNYGGDYPFIKPTDMEIDRRYVTNWEENYSEKAFKRYKNSYIPPKATGVVTIGTVGEKIFQADRYCFTNQSVNVVIPNENYDEDFVYYALKINLPKVLNANPGTASGRHHVSKSNFCAIKIDVPKSKETQRKIATILSAYDDLIENNLKLIKLLEEQAQLTYEEWFVRFKFPGHETTKFNEETGLPEGWEKVKLGDLAKVKGGKRLPKGHGLIDVKTNHPYIRVKDLTNGTVDLTSLVYINEQTHLSIKRYIISKDDIYISIAGTVGLVGIIPPIISNANLTENCAKITELENDFLQDYICLFLQSTKGQYHIEARTGGASQPKLALYRVAAIPIILPTKVILEQFSLYSKKIRFSINNLQIQNQHLKEARDILLPRLMSGMIDVDKLEVGSTTYEVTEQLGMVAEENKIYSK